MLDFSSYLSPGEGIWWGQLAAEPESLVHTFLDQADQIGPLRAFVGMTWDERLIRHLPAGLEVMSYGGLGNLRWLSKIGRLSVVPCNYSALPRMFAEHRLPCDVGLVQVSPPDADGLCSLGIGVDYVADAIAHTRLLIAEINTQMPATVGSARIPLNRFAAVVECDRPLRESPRHKIGDAETAIARHVANLVEDRDTLQLGVGVIPEAVIEALKDHRDMGFHSGMLSEGVLDLVDRGAISGAYKEIDHGKLVTGAAVGSVKLYHRIEELGAEFKPASYTHAPEVLAQLKSFVAINSAIEVDLTGQVGSELRRGIYVGALGGQADFSRAAASTGARSIIAMRSTSRGESTIRPCLEGGVVTTARSDVDYLVTEHGVAELRGCNLEERARRIIKIAAPEHRDHLDKSLRKLDRSLDR